ncbi:MAG TPA: ribonuclease HII [Acidimicrobiales bacterium]|nr:ribonuclease HII [Acidimicrobiales bacterium]
MIQEPDLATERALWRRGHRVVAGVDEVGRGAWAGPLTVGVALVGVPEDTGPAGIDGRRLPPTRRRVPPGLRDSKMLPEARREEVFSLVTRWCTAWAVGHAEAAECDDLGMTAALRLATARAFAALPAGLAPDAVVVDGPMDFVTPPAQGSLALGHDAAGVHEWWSPEVRTEVDGDARCASVAAASVLAKVTRDRIMREHASSYPAFDFDRNKGYPSPSHQRALCGYGLTSLHRRSWAFVDDLPWRRQWAPPVSTPDTARAARAARSADAPAPLAARAS